MRSRCQSLFFQRPAKADALQWLAKQSVEGDVELLLNLANGAPCAALQLEHNDVLKTRNTLFELLYSLSKQQADPIKSVADVKDLALLSVLDLMISWIIDLLRLHLHCGDDDLRNKDHASRLAEVKQRVTFSQALSVMNEIQQLRKHVCEGINVNPQLTLEAVLVRWRETTACC